MVRLLVAGRPALRRRDASRMAALVRTLDLVSHAASSAAASTPTEASSVSRDRAFGRAKAVMVVFLTGGAPQHDTWDPKPDAPAEIRGETRPIATVVPGLHVGDLMPKIANLAQHTCVLRAMSTADNAHSSSGYWMLTGLAASTAGRSRTPAPRAARTMHPVWRPSSKPCVHSAVICRPRSDWALPLNGSSITRISREAWPRWRLSRTVRRSLAAHVRSVGRAFKFP